MATNGEWFPDRPGPLTKLAETVPQDMSRLDRIVMGVNYGFEKVRFVNPVKVFAKVPASSVLTAVDQKDPNTF